MRKLLTFIFLICTLVAGAQITIPISAATGTVTIPSASMPQDINIQPTSTPVTLTANFILTTSSTPQPGSKWTVTIQGPIIFNSHTMSIFGQNLVQNNVSATGAVSWSMTFGVVYNAGTPTIIPVSQPSSFNQSQSLLGTVLQYNSTPTSTLIDTTPAYFPLANSSGVFVDQTMTGPVTIGSNGATTITAGSLTPSMVTPNIGDSSFIWLYGPSGALTPTKMTGQGSLDSRGNFQVCNGCLSASNFSSAFCNCQTAQITIDSAQITSLYSNPVTIVATIPGKTILVEAAAVSLTYNSAAFGTHANLVLLTNSATQSQYYASGVLAITTSGVSLFTPTITGAAQLVQSQPLQVSVSGGNPTGGNAASQITVFVWYTTF